MKKRYRIALAACMTAAALTACQGKAAEPDASAAVSEKTGTGASETKEKKQGGKESSGVFESFTAQDLDGNQVDETIFEDAELAMINVWGTFCTPCLEEMPDLAELNREYQEKGVQIIGICSDTINADKELDEAQLEKARELAEQTGADYPHIAMSGTLVDTLLPQVMAVPMTIFVDSEGTQVGTAYMGARDKEGWAGILDEVLASVQ